LRHRIGFTGKAVDQKLVLKVSILIMKIIPVVLCGGSGTRLWPLSRTGFPKQFLVLSGTTSLFQQAASRLNQLGAADIEVGKTLVVTNEEHRFLVLDQLRELPDIAATLLLEPVGRNTAPALTLVLVTFNKQETRELSQNLMSKILQKNLIPPQLKFM